MSSEDKARLSPWYLNTRRLSVMAGSQLPASAQAPLSQNSGARVDGMWRAAQLADALWQSGRVPNLTREVLSGTIEGDRVIAAIWGVFTFRGLTEAMRRQGQGKEFKAATFSGSIPMGEETYAFSGSLSNDHVYSDTAVGLLSGKRRALLIGQFQFDGERVEVFPIIIGDLIEELGGFLPISWGSRARVYPSQIDAFREIQTARGPTAAQIKSLLTIPEETVKAAFAELLGEPFVPKDWGGEKSDLQTNQVTLDGEPVSAAFIFKGPGLPGPMHPANMGKRGDQLLRAFDEPVDLVVIQHCNKIENTVIRQAEALAADPRNPRRYCIIDGADTYRILAAYKKLPAADGESAT